MRGAPVFDKNNLANPATSSSAHGNVNCSLFYCKTIKFSAIFIAMCNYYVFKGITTRTYSVGPIRLITANSRRRAPTAAPFAWRPEAIAFIACDVPEEISPNV